MSMELEPGAFSISLTVKDLAASRAFYEKLGFTVTGGNAEHNYLILKNGTTMIGLFHGMFDKNVLTFNPGLTNEMTSIDQALTEFTDIRDIQAELEKRGLELQSRADESGTGPASITLIDPDGNPILIDQHMNKPGS